MTTKILSFGALFILMADLSLAQENQPTTPASMPGPLPSLKNLWVPILPPTTATGADALDSRLYELPTFEPGEITSTKHYTILPHLGLASFYDSNLTLSRNQPIGDFAQAIEPGITLGLGDLVSKQNNYIGFDYTGRYTSYADHSNINSFEQFATLEAQFRLAKVQFNTNFTFLDLDDGDIDSGSRMWRHIFDFHQVISYQLTEKSSLEAQFENVLKQYQTGPGSDEYTGRFFYNYQFDPKLQLGGGMAGGFLHVDGESDQSYQQFLLRASFDPNPKWAFNFEGGMEMRQIPGQDRFTPVGKASLTYLPRAGTTTSLNAYSQSVSSSNANLDYTAMGADLKVNQEFGPRWSASVKAGYARDSYFFTNSGSGSSRRENFYYVTPSLEYHFNKNAQIQLFYNYRENNSNISLRGFADDQVGIRAKFSF